MTADADHSGWRSGWEGRARLVRLSRHRLELRPQSGTPLQGRGQPFDRAQGGGTDVMLHAFDVVMNDAIVHAKEPEEIGEQTMPVSDVARQRLAGGGQNE